MGKKGEWIVEEFDEMFGDGIISVQSDEEEEERNFSQLMKIMVDPTSIIITEARNVRNKNHPPLLPQIIS